MILSILIATVPDRKEMFDKLMAKFNIIGYEANQIEVEIVHDATGKEMSIGKKRNKLLGRATGDWIVFFDDDDWPYDEYISLIVNAIKSNPDIDCIGINVDMTTNGKNPQRCCHSFKYPQWQDNVDGWDYVRNITHFNPVKREMALKTGFKDIRYGEDKDYSDRLYPLLKKEFYIQEPLFHYRYTTAIPHKKKYGIK